jgi:hypothetical protein
MRMWSGDCKENVRMVERETTGMRLRAIISAAALNFATQCTPEDLDRESDEILLALEGLRLREMFQRKDRIWYFRFINISCSNMLQQY